MNAEWIDASSKRPVPFERVLGFRPGYVPYICYVNRDGEWFTLDHIDLHHLTHWMPLPKLPKCESSFEKWWGQAKGFNVIQQKLRLEPREAAYSIWKAALAASKKPDFVE